jgi:hypothetical protein
MDTPGKVSFASSTIGIQRGDSSSSKSVSKYGFPRRIPKGRIDKVGDREGTSRSSSAAASALGHNSLSKPMIQGEGGTKASSRKGDRATDIIDGKGRIDNVGDREGTSRSSSAAASALGHNPLSKPMSQGEGGTKASSRKGDQATDIIDGKGRIDKVGDREGTSRSSLACKSIMPTGQVEDLPLPGSPREENDDIIISRGSKSWLIEGVIVKSKVYLAGNFNDNVNLSNLTEEIESSGGIVIDAITGADIVVVGDQSKDEDVQSMSTNTSTPRIDLELLYKVMKLEVPLWDIAGTPSKVSCTEPNNQPSAYAVPGRQNCKMSHTSIPSPKRYPLSQIKYTGSLSASPPSYLAISQRVLEQSRLMEKFDQANPCFNAHQGTREALKSSLSVLPPSLQVQVARTSGGSSSGQSQSTITPDPLLAKIKTLAARRRPLSQLKYTRGGSPIIASPPTSPSESMQTTTNPLESPSRSPITASLPTSPRMSRPTALTMSGSPISSSVLSLLLTNQSASIPIRERGSEQSDINRKGVPLKNPIFEHFKVVEKEEPFFDIGASPKKDPLPEKYTSDYISQVHKPQ